MRITADLVSLSPQFLNPLKEREIDLRGNKISYIENLGTTKDQFDTMDLSDNEIRRLENIPLLTRLKTLLLCNNRLSFINGETVGNALPNLESLILTNNLLRDFSQIEPLRYLKKLTNLSLLDNMVTKKENYRFYVINLIPSLRVLDFKKIKMQEREKAKELFGSIAKEPSVAKTFEPGKPEIEEQQENKLTPEQIEKIKQAILKSNNLTEIARLEMCLRSNVMPPELQ